MLKQQTLAPSHFAAAAAQANSRGQRASVASCERAQAEHQYQARAQLRPLQANNTSNNVRSSTISKVPSAKSRLKLPVASANCRPSPTSGEENQQRVKEVASSLARPKGGATEQVIEVIGSQAPTKQQISRLVPSIRPTSVPLKISPQASNKTPIRSRIASALSVSTSRTGLLLPLQRQTLQNNSSPATRNAHQTSKWQCKSGSNPLQHASAHADPVLGRQDQSPGGQSTKSSETKTPSIVSNKTRQRQQQHQSNFRKKGIVEKRQQLASGPVNGQQHSQQQARTSRLSGIKSLVAIVHPQFSLSRVNSSATSCPRTKTSPLGHGEASRNCLEPSFQTKPQTGKVNFNHEDINGRVDGGQLKPTTASAKAMKESKQDEGGVELTTTSAATEVAVSKLNNNFSRLATRKDKNDDQHNLTKRVSENNHKQEGGSSLLLMESTGGGGMNFHEDECPGMNCKQFNRNSMLAATSKIAAITMQSSCPRPMNTVDRSNNIEQKDPHCTNATSESSLKDRDSSEIKLPLTRPTYDSLKSELSGNGGHIIENQILAKPVGQRLLSLMMLDVGLMPATNNSKLKSYNPRKSYVRLQGSNEASEANSLSTSRGQLADSNCTHSDDDCCREYQYGSKAAQHNTLEVQVCFSTGSGDNLKSISLPSSPRATRRVRSNRVRLRGKNLSNKFINEGYDRRFPTITANEDCLLNSQAVFASNLLRDKEKAKAKLLCDSELNPNSKSSSSSSLNCCPPFLTLSNQLEDMKFDELVRSKIANFAHGTYDAAGEIHREFSSSSKHVNRQKLEVNDASQSEKLQSIKQVCRDEEPLKACGGSISICDGSDSFEQITSKITECTDSQAPLSEETRDKNNVPTVEQQGHQQVRSHSISGQEIYSTRSFAHLKPNLYPANMQVGLQHGQFSTQNDHRLMSIPTDYGNQQALARSPSPHSVCGGAPVSNDYAQRDYAMLRSSLERQRNQLHASLECLNAGYTDYNHQKFIQHQHYQHSQQPHHLVNQHYAASYQVGNVTQPHNRNEGSDNSAATNSIYPRYQSGSTLDSSSNSSSGHYQHQVQNILSRVISQSPLRRPTKLTNSTFAGSGVATPSTFNHHSIRSGHSSLSLASSSLLVEDKLQNEIRRLQAELKSEKEKNDALNSQLNINSSLMAAFEQSLTTLNSRLRQLTTLNEKKDKEIEELREQINCTKVNIDSETKDVNHSGLSVSSEELLDSIVPGRPCYMSDNDSKKVIEDLKRQLSEKDRLLTDTRLEALSATHQLEQLESRLNGEHSLLVNEDDLDEGVMLTNHSPSDSDAVTDSVNFCEVNNPKDKLTPGEDLMESAFQFSLSKQTISENTNKNDDSDQSNGSCDERVEDSRNDKVEYGTHETSKSAEIDSVDKLMDSLLLIN